MTQSSALMFYVFRRMLCLPPTYTQSTGCESGILAKDHEILPEKINSGKIPELKHQFYTKTPLFQDRETLEKMNSF